MYGVKRIRNLVANTVVFWPSWQCRSELNLCARHKLCPGRQFQRFVPSNFILVFRKEWKEYAVLRDIHFPRQQMESDTVIELSESAVKALQKQQKPCSFSLSTKQLYLNLPVRAESCYIRLPDLNALGCSTVLVTYRRL